MKINAPLKAKEELEKTSKNGELGGGFEILPCGRIVGQMGDPENYEKEVLAHVGAGEYENAKN